MSRKSRSTLVEDDTRPTETEVDDTDHHGFWDSARLDTEDNDDAFSLVLEADDGGEHETLVYMGNVGDIDPREISILARWSESKACRGCTRRFFEHHELSRLKHEECRKAMRVAHLLRSHG
jgi:hypothetical protein